MSAIRPVERRDLDEVAALYELVMRSGDSTPPPGLAPYLERVLLDQPWADPEIPSLVSVDDAGRIVGFQGSSVRRAVFDGQPVRIGCGGQLVSHPDARHRAVGALMFRTYLGGPQDLTMTDTAGEPMRKIGMALGMKLVHLSCVGWVRVLRPASWATLQVRERRGSRRRAGRGRVLSVIDDTAARLGGVLSPPAEPDVTAEPLTPAALVEHLPVVTRKLRLHLDYDERYVAWLFAELAAMKKLGRPVASLVRDAGGRVLGWYVYFLLPGGTARVLQVAAPERHVGRVLDHLLHAAWTGGAAAVQGRLEPRLLEPLSSRRVLMAYRGGALVHSRNREILGAITSGDSLLTRLDAEWWTQDEMLDLSR